MIRRIQALNYRCLRYVDLELDRFHVAVGPNASGKSTLFDVVAFLGDMVRDGVDAAVEKRTRNFQDLVWGRSKDNLRFELAVEFEIPEEVHVRLPEDRGFRFFRYEVAVEERDKQVRIDSDGDFSSANLTRFSLNSARCFLSRPLSAAEFSPVAENGGPELLSKSPRKQDNFNIEVSPQSGKGWAVSVSFGPHRSALGNLPESPDKFPAATHVKRTLTEGVSPCSGRRSHAGSKPARLAAKRLRAGRIQPALDSQSTQGATSGRLLAVDGPRPYRFKI